MKKLCVWGWLVVRCLGMVWQGRPNSWSVTRPEVGASNWSSVGRTDTGSQGPKQGNVFFLLWDNSYEIGSESGMWWIQTKLCSNGENTYVWLKLLSSYTVSIECLNFFIYDALGLIKIFCGVDVQHIVLLWSIISHWWDIVNLSGILCSRKQLWLLKMEWVWTLSLRIKWYKK